MPKDAIWSMITSKFWLNFPWEIWWNWPFPQKILAVSESTFFKEVFYKTFEELYQKAPDV